MRPRRIALMLVLLSFAFLGMAFLTSCVNVPIPPFGDRIGELGNLQLALSAKYIPLQWDRAFDSAECGRSETCDD